MGSKSTLVFVLFCVLNFLQIQGSFIKPNNVPRVGRSNEADGPFDPSAVGYVFKTVQTKNIPRMGRRNYDSENRYDIPKLYQAPSENIGYYDGEGQLESYYSNYDSMKR